MLAERGFAYFSDKVLGVWFLADERFGDPDELFLFQRFDMAGQVPVGEVEELFQCVEVERLIYGQCRHDAQPYAAFESFI